MKCEVLINAEVGKAKMMAVSLKEGDHYFYTEVSLDGLNMDAHDTLIASIFHRLLFS